jgi:hypothetical protein
VRAARKEDEKLLCRRWIHWRIGLSGGHRAKTWNTSMMTMRMPPHGEIAVLGSTAALAGTPLEFETSSSSRAGLRPTRKRA